MKRVRRWTPEEYEYLIENWGNKSLRTIANHLNRSPNAVKIKVDRLGLGAFLDSGDYITFNQLLNALGIRSYSYKAESWIKRRKLPVKYKRVKDCSFRIICVDDFWKWAEKNRGFIDWTKFEENILGKEPDWVKEQRRLCTLAKMKYHTGPWTPGEDEWLKRLLKQYKYTWSEIARMMHRTEGAIQRRIIDLGLKERPIKSDNHNPWSDEDYQLLGELIKQGHHYETLSEILARSTKAIRGRVYSMYLTENLDKVRTIIGDSNWGDNRPDRPVTHPTLTSAERQEVRQNISLLAGILKASIKSRCIAMKGECYEAEIA